MRYIAFLIACLLSSPALCQSSGNFTNGPPPLSAQQLNSAFQRKADYPYAGPIGGVVITGPAAVGLVPIGTGATTAVWSSTFPILMTFNAGISVASPFTVLGSSSGIITLQPQAAAGTYNWNWPITAGTSGYVLTSAGGGSSPMTWTNLALYAPLASPTFTGTPTAPNWTATAVAPTVTSGQIGYGGTVVASSDCGSLMSAAGCIVVNIAGTAHYIPYY